MDKRCGTCVLWVPGPTGGWGECQWANWRKPPLMELPYAHKLKHTRHFEGTQCPAWEVIVAKMDRTGPPEPAADTGQVGDPTAIGPETQS